MDKVLSFIRLGGIGNGVNRQGLRNQVAGVMAHRLHRSHRFLSPAEPMEQREQNHVLHGLCRVATEEDESQIKEIKEIFFHTEITALELCSLATKGTQEITESASGTGCAQNFKSRRNKGNHRKCLRHRLRTISEAKNFCDFREYLCEIRISLDDYG